MQKRELLVDAALQQFQSAGITKSSIEMLTKSAGMSKGAFYQHFKTKDDLVIATMDRFYQLLFENEPTHPTSANLLQARMEWEITYVLKQRSFIYEVFALYPIGTNEAMNQVFRTNRERLKRWRQDAILRTFPSKVTNSLDHLEMLLDGMLHSYLQRMMWQDDQLSPYDSSVLITKAAEALVEADLSLPKTTNPVTVDNLRETVQHILQATSLSRDTRTLLHEMNKQLSTDEPSIIIIDALLERVQTLHICDFVQRLSLQWRRYTSQIKTNKE
ncbi:TetR/AcrR family transcriptional regulator [Paenalkalicoccus suaedae]|uniref:TetR/AcrR family transcriptional regulator n=1 Tax=Paenalkalicoccus suaedae TaxID=2592382 RepID=A0A859FH75_9BACI|nr:TetR/AcrR family transcriptional regulator [Paenalkalicoccus suaedae]QKS72713.1 TetR/AcrR family transcriptional regulator [Paenalkalicoccus suaedae]